MCFVMFSCCIFFRGLQQGSLPITNPYNTTYPPNTNIQSRHQLGLFHMKTDQSLVLLTTMPEPGVWYIVAFLQKSSDNKIAQQVKHYWCHCFIVLCQKRIFHCVSSQTRTITSFVFGFYMCNSIVLFNEN